MYFIVANPTPTSTPNHKYFLKNMWSLKKTWHMFSCNHNIFIYLKNSKSSSNDYVLSRLLSWSTLIMHTFLLQTPHQKHNICDEAGESKWALDFPAVKLLDCAGSNFWFVTRTSAAQDGDEDPQMKAWIWFCSLKSNGFWRYGLHPTNKINSSVTASQWKPLCFPKQIKLILLDK